MKLLLSALCASLIISPLSFAGSVKDIKKDLIIAACSKCDCDKCKKGDCDKCDKCKKAKEEAKLADCGKCKKDGCDKDKKEEAKLA